MDRRHLQTSLYLAEGHFIVHFLSLLLILTVAALAFRTTRLLQRTPTATVGAHWLSSKRQSGYHWWPGRFVIKNSLDLTHYIRVQFRDKLKIEKKTCMNDLQSDVTNDTPLARRLLKIKRIINVAARYLQALQTLVQLIYIGCTEQKALNTFIL